MSEKLTYFQFRAYPSHHDDHIEVRTETMVDNKKFTSVHTLSFDDLLSRSFMDWLFEKTKRELVYAIEDHNQQTWTPKIVEPGKVSGDQLTKPTEGAFVSNVSTSGRGIRRKTDWLAVVRSIRHPDDE